MSVLSAFMKTQLLKVLEDEFQAAEPEMKAIIVQEIQDFATDAFIWAKDKFHSQQPKD